MYLIANRLDEAKESMSPTMFSAFDGGFHNYKADFVSVNARNLLKPLLEVYDTDIKFLLIDGVLNSDMNP